MTTPIALAVITSPRGVLLGRRPDGFWVFPGGKLEPGESVTEAAARETLEETGLTVEDEGRLGSRQHPATGVPVHYVACVVRAGEAQAQDGSGLTEVRWVSAAEADGLTGGTMFEPVRRYLGYVEHENQ